MQTKLIKMKSSKSKQPSPANQEVMPQFACAVYIDANGNQQMSYNVIGNFPKSLILPGLLMVAGHVKANLLDKVQPGEDNDKAIEVLEDIVETQAINDEVSPESEAILRLQPKPTEDSE